MKMSASNSSSPGSTDKTASLPSPNTKDIVEEDNEIQCYVYDLSRGIAKTLSVALIGQQLEGIWHSSIVVYGQEYFYGAGGITNCLPCETILGRPTRVHPIGRTEIPEDLFLIHIQELKDSIYKGSAYDLFHHNCNNFSNELAQFLCSSNIPEYVLNLPETILNTPLGQLLKSFADQSLLRQRGGYDPNPLEELIRDGVLKVSGLDKEMGDSSDEGGTPPPRKPIKKRDVVAEVEEEERKEREEKKKNREPPIVFRDICSSVDELLDELEKSLAKVELNEEEMRCLKELREYAVGDEGSWVLSDDFLGLIARILLGGESGIGDDSRTYCLKVLAWLAVTKDDVILVLHQDRKDHVIMRYANSIDQMSPSCQESVALLLCNLFENLSTSEWLLYISEWDSDGKGVTSNIRVTTKVGVHALLSKEYKDVGSALIYNMVTKEVKSAIFDDVAVELAMAILQFLSEKPPEPLSWRALKCLLRCCQLARSEVPGLVQMVGPPPSNYKGTSKRCDEVIASIDGLLKSV